MSEAERFEKAFIQCLEDKVHPGPAELNDRMGKGRNNKLNGRLTSHRLQLMHDFGVPYKLGPDKGKTPTFSYIDTRQPAGWRCLST
jgi:hypothetical protein